jgi:dTDP-4-dehydrorhamnose reductase
MPNSKYQRLKVKSKILGTGLSGLIGSRIAELLSNKYQFEDLSLDTGVDITDQKIVDKKISTSSADIILHMAAITDVDGCEKEKDKKKESLSWKVNVEGTKNITKAAGKYDKKIILMSTDFVFDGTNPPYDEDSIPNPINWYAKTKLESERLVMSQNIDNITVRTSFPYRSEFKQIDIIRYFLNRLKNKQKVRAIDDWVITPTFIDDITYALDKLITLKKNGVFHIVGSSSHTPFEIANITADKFSLDNSLIERVKLDDLFINKAPRPKNLITKNDKITKLGIKMKNFIEGIEEIKKQMNKKKL